MLGEVVEKALVVQLDIIYEFDNMKLEKTKRVNLFLKSPLILLKFFYVFFNHSVVVSSWTLKVPPNQLNTKSTQLLMVIQKESRRLAIQAYPAALIEVLSASICGLTTSYTLSLYSALMVGIY